MHKVIQLYAVTPTRVPAAPCNPRVRVPMDTHAKGGERVLMAASSCARKLSGMMSVRVRFE
jgi:hypothetical protein